jgi:hypothetical protein
MKHPIRACLAALALALGASDAIGDTASYIVDGTCTGGDPTSFRVTIAFTATGGNFNNGTGKAIASFTIENTCGLVPFQDPGKGNPVLTSFNFNVPPGTGVSYTQATILAGATLFSTGTVINGIVIPAGTTLLSSDQVRTNFYELLGSTSTGQFGIFTSSLQTANGIAAGLADAHLFSGLVKQGDCYSPAVICGAVKFSVSLTRLGASLNSAGKFANFCSTVTGQRTSSSFAGKFQATGVGGGGSCWNATPCGASAARPTTWGALKAVYR